VLSLTARNIFPSSDRKNISKNFYMMRFKQIFFTILLAFSIFFPVVQTYAQVDLGVGFGAETGLTNKDPRDVTVRVITTVLGLLGIVLTCLILYAGFLWMTAGGSEDKIGEAKKILSSSVIGLLIILSAWSITTFIFKNVYQATTGNKLLD
jgi:hypothetical protein